MKTLAVAISFIIVVALSSCKNPCKGYVSYNKIDPRLRNYIFQAGSYWVYQDSASGAIDSQIVFKFVDKYVQTDPCQQPVTPPSNPTHECCGPYSYDLLTMSVVAFKDSRMDSLLFTAGNSGLGLESYDQSVSTKSDDLFLLDPGSPPGPDTKYRLFYLGKINALTQNGVNYSDVLVFQTRYNSQLTLYFTCTTDLYFCSGYGIIKKIEHTSSGDVVWTLKRFSLI